MRGPSKSLTLRRVQAASERGRKMSARRWAIDRALRAKLAAQDPAFTGLHIIRRIVVIDQERSVREAVIYETDSARDARAKLRHILAA